jgi:hypothetical protein
VDPGVSAYRITTAAYTLALEDQGLLGEAERRMIAPNSDTDLPILLAVSDNGPQMVSGTTREWLALSYTRMLWMRS